MNVLDIALGYIARGWAPVPVPYRRKYPEGLTDWQKLRITAETAALHFNCSPQNIGVLTGEPSNGLADVDLDCPEAIAVAPYFLPRTQAMFGRKTAPAAHWLYVVANAGSLDTFRDPKSAADESMLVELRQSGFQTVFPGSVHKDTGEPITWEQGYDGEPAVVDATDLLKRVRRLAAAALLARCFPGIGSRDDFCLMLGGFLHRAGLSEGEARTFIEAVARAGGSDAPAERAKKGATVREGKNLAGFPKLAEWIGEERAKAVAEWLGYRGQAATAAAGDWHIDAFSDAGEPDLSDDQLALDLGRSGWDRDARYCAPIGGWVLWDGTRWRPVVGMKHMPIVRNFLRASASRLLAWAERKAEEEKDEAKAEKLVAWAKQTGKALRSEPKAAAVERTARSNPQALATHDQFDADDFLLGTPGGVVDLRTGELRPPDRASYITKLTAVAPAPPGAPAPRWDAYLASCHPNAPEIPAFLQRLAGYSLTGAVREHRAFFFWGEGRNGKGTFLNLLEWLWADYSANVATSVLLETRSLQHTAPLAMLRGARLARGSEISGGAAWDEPILKRLTGGDPITANLMRQDPITFTPKLTLIIDANRRPRIRTVDEAMKSRMVLVPWLRKFSEAERDENLGDKLRDEGPAILRWAIDGAVAWQRDGLGIPKSVREATSSYLETEDELGQFLLEETVEGVNARVRSSDLYQRFVQWQDAQGAKRWTQKALSVAIVERGFRSTRDRAGALFLGLALKAADGCV